MALVSAKLADSDWHDDNRRSDQRTEINRSAVLRFGGGAYDILVADLTREGCRITTSLDLEPGSLVTLGFAGIGHTVGRVVWRDGQSFGCLFEADLPSGAVTAATLNNVDRLHGLVSVSTPVGPQDVKWSRGRQLTLIVGSSAVLWAAIIAGLAVIF